MLHTSRSPKGEPRDLTAAEPGEGLVDGALVAVERRGGGVAASRGAVRDARALPARHGAS